jgi:hypothetical protein
MGPHRSFCGARICTWDLLVMSQVRYCFSTPQHGDRRPQLPNVFGRAFFRRMPPLSQGSRELNSASSRGWSPASLPRASPTSTLLTAVFWLVKSQVNLYFVPPIQKCQAGIRAAIEPIVPTEPGRALRTPELGQLRLASTAASWAVSAASCLPPQASGWPSHGCTGRS